MDLKTDNAPTMIVIGRPWRAAPLNLRLPDIYRIIFNFSIGKGTAGCSITAVLHNDSHPGGTAAAGGGNIETAGYRRTVFIDSHRHFGINP